MMMVAISPPPPADRVAGSDGVPSLSLLRGRFNKTLSMPLLLQVPGDEFEASSAPAASGHLLSPVAQSSPPSGLHCLIVSLANGTGSGVAPLPFPALPAPALHAGPALPSPPAATAAAVGTEGRASSVRAQCTPRSLTPPPYSSSPVTHSASLLQPFSFAFGSKTFLDLAAPLPSATAGGRVAGNPAAVAFAAAAAQDGVQVSGPHFGAAAHQGARQSMQDSFTCQPGCKTFVVADGHGRQGHIVAALSTAMLPGLLTKALAEQQQQQHGSPPNAHVPSVPAALRKAFRRMDEHVLKHTTQGGSTALLLHVAPASHAFDPDTADGSEGAATTAAVLASSSANPSSQALFLAHLGDSRAVLSCSGRAKALTTDHKPEHPLERRGVEARGGSVVRVQRGAAGGKAKQAAMEQAMASAVSLGQVPRSGFARPCTPPQLRERMLPPIAGVHAANGTPAGPGGFTPFSSAFGTVPVAPAVDQACPPAAATAVMPSPSSSSSSSSGGEFVWRVEGQLNLSRSLGDAHLRPFVSNEPSIGVHVLRLPPPTLQCAPASASVLRDEFVIMASDGLWGVLGEQEAVQAVHDFVALEGRRAAPVTSQQPQTQPIHSLAARAADHLAQMALKAGSQDNVCVVVLFLGEFGQF